MNIPKEVKELIEKLNKEGFEAFMVGGCVRDILMKKEPNDWDIATNAEPEKIKEIFPNSFYENKFLTVTVKTGSKDESLKEVEITTYRSEAKYSDKRHPDEVQIAKNLEEDLSRRDFTINAIATDGKKIIDPFKGKKDLEKKIIKAVGKPEERFSEDALRMMRAVRFSSVLGFKIEKKTFEAIKKNSKWLKNISGERIKDEFVKIVMSPSTHSINSGQAGSGQAGPACGIELLREAGLLEQFMPELLESYEVEQNKHHIYDCWTHALKALDYASKKGFKEEVRIASLLHDIGKPKSKRGKGEEATFYNHEIIGAKMAEKILERLKFSKKESEKIVKLVRYHLFYYNVGEVKEASVRRLVAKVGLEDINDLLEVRMADRIGSGVPKAEPYKLRHLKYLVEKVSGDPISAKMLKVNGNDVMEILSIKPGPKIGQIIDILLGGVLAEPDKNDKEFLRNQIKLLGKLKDKELEDMARNARNEREKVETKKDEMTKKKYWVV